MCNNRYPKYHLSLDQANSTLESIKQFISKQLDINPSNIVFSAYDNDCFTKYPADHNFFIHVGTKQLYANMQNNMICDTDMVYTILAINHEYRHCLYVIIALQDAHPHDMKQLLTYQPVDKTYDADYYRDSRNIVYSKLFDPMTKTETEGFLEKLVKEHPYMKGE